MFSLLCVLVTCVLVTCFGFCKDFCVYAYSMYLCIMLYVLYACIFVCICNYVCMYVYSGFLSGGVGGAFAPPWLWLAPPWGFDLKVKQFKCFEIFNSCTMHNN